MLGCRTRSEEGHEAAAMRPLTRHGRKQSGGSAYIRSPSSAVAPRDALPFSQRYGNSPLSPNSAGNPAAILQGRRRQLIRSLGGGTTICVALFFLLLFFGAFDHSPRIGGNIHPYTFQVQVPGDPWKRKGIEYSRPPNYWEFQADWNAPSRELAANPGPSTRKCDPNGPLLL